MVIPGSVKQADEANAAFHKTARQQAIGSEGVVLSRPAPTLGTGDGRIGPADTVGFERGLASFDRSTSLSGCLYAEGQP